MTQNDVAVSLAGGTSDKRISCQRGLPQGAPESPATFVAVSDHVLGDLDTGWRNRNIWWKMDNIDLTNIAYADDICLLASCRNDLEVMVKECTAGYGQHFLSDHQALDPMVQDNHTCRCENPSLRKQRISDDQQATKSHRCV